MMAFTMVQLTIDALFAAALLFLWFWKPGDSAENDERVASILRQTEEKMIEWDEELGKIRARYESEIGKLTAICVDAKEIVERNKWQNELTGPSQEEKELKAGLHTPISESRSKKTDSPIPRLIELEEAKARIQPDISVDLRSLLSDQLA